jgi:hypothetical protein
LSAKRLISVAAVAVVLFAVIGAAASARSRPRSYTGNVWVGIKGWGSVKATKGVYSRPTFRCTNAACPAADGLLHGRRVVLVASTNAGWKFAGWHGACKHKKPKCAIDAARAHKNASGARNVRVSATFVPVSPGLTRARPIPVGTAKSLGNGFTVRVNSTTPNVQLSPPPPPGAEYFAANLTVTYTGGGQATARDAGTYSAIGSHTTSYDPFGNACPAAPKPPLDFSSAFYSGQSTSGYICWTVAANDGAGLEMYFGSGTLDYPGTTWFALH